MTHNTSQWSGGGGGGAAGQMITFHSCQLTERMFDDFMWRSSRLASVAAEARHTRFNHCNVGDKWGKLKEAVKTAIMCFHDGHLRQECREGYD